MADIEIETIKVFLDEQVIFNYFTVIVFTIGFISGKLFKIPKRVSILLGWNKGDTRNESDNIQSHNKRLRVEFNLFNFTSYTNHPPSPNQENEESTPKQGDS